MRYAEPKYAVLNDHTLGYLYHWPDSDLVFMGVLAGDIHGHDWKNGPVHVGSLDTVRAATKEDFERFRVSSKGHIE